MEVDQTVVSNVDNENMPVATTDNVLPESPDKSPEMENDELPALVISDSEGDEPPANPTEKITVSSSDRENEVNISGVTPLDASVMDGVTKDSSVVEVESVENPSPVSEKEAEQTENIVVVDVEQQQRSCIYENIDLTGASSADDSGVSDEGTEKMVRRREEESVEKVVKDSASLTAQELLQSLLGDREDDYRLKGFGVEKADPKGECSDMIKLNDESLEQSRDQNIAVEPTLDQEKQVSCSSENDPADSIQDKITTTYENSKQDSDAISSPKEGNTLEVSVLEEKKASQHSSEEKTSGNDEAGSHPDVDKTVSCDTQVSRSTKESNNEDDDDDVICLLEEMAEEDQLDSNSLSNEEIASPPTESTVVPSKQSDSSTIPEASVEDKETEPDSNDEPPTKRQRSSKSHDDVEDLERLVCQDNITSNPGTIPTQSFENCDNGNDKPDAAESTKTDDNSEPMMEQEQSEMPNRSRPSSSIGDPAECPMGLNTTETIFLTSTFETTATLAGVETNNTVGERTTVVPSLSSEVLVIDDDDDDDDDGGNGGKTMDSTKDCKLGSPDIGVGGKRPREDLESENTKKPKMADESTDTADNLAKEGDVVQKPPDVKPLPLEFMKMFAKPLAKMSRDDLEEFVMQKICEGMVYKSHLGEERKRLDKLETVMLKYRQRLKDMHKQYSDLQVVHDRAVQDLQKRANRFVVPVKVTRAVGLQVGAPQFPQLGHPTATRDPTGEDVKTKNGIAELSVIPAKRDTISPECSTKGTSTGAPGNGAHPAAIGQRMSTSTAGGIHPAPNVIRPSVPMNVTYMHNATASAVTIKPPDPSKPTVGSIVNVAPGTSYPSGTSVSSSGSSTGSVSPGMTARKKTLHKITPKRPPLSAVQQEEQEKMARQQAEQMLQDIHCQQARIAKIAACSGSKVGGGNSPTGIRPTAPDVRTTAIARSNVNLFRPATLSSLMPAVQPIASMHTVRVTSSKTTTFTNSVASIAPPSQTAPTSAAANSLIDLTDEEEPRGPVDGHALLNNVIEKNLPNQNGMLEKQLGSVEMIANNQMLKLSQAQIKTKQQYRLLNGNGTIQSIATASTHTQSMALSNNVGFRAHLGKKPNGLRMPLGIPPTTHGQIRHSGPFADNALMMKIPSRPPLRAAVHPAPLPKPGPQSCHPSWKQLPPQPVIRINNVPTGIVISWSMPDLSEMHAEIDIYQIYAYQESNAIPTSAAWRHVGDVKALPLPMAVTLTHFSEGLRYHFAVRAIDEHKRFGFFSDPRTWNEINALQ